MSTTAADPTTAEPIRGACLCGGVTFELTPPSRFCAHCHCSMCRRAHGAPLVTWSGFREEQLQVTKGAELLRDYASSPGARRSFCSVCGSSLFFRAQRWAGEVHVATANLLGELDRKPGAHVFYSDRAAWFAGHDGLPRRGGVTGVEPIE